MDVRCSMFLKKRTKYARTLKVEEESSLPAKCQKMLFQMGKLVKYSPNLDLNKSSGLAPLKLSKLQKGIKLFKSVKSIKLPDRLDDQYFNLSITLLKQCKNLTSFASCLPALKPITPEKKSQFKSKENFISDLLRKKLKIIHFSAGDNCIGIPFTEYPSTLQEITYQFNPDILRPFPTNFLTYYQVFSHMKNLKHLNLSIAAYARILSQMLSSIPNPNNLESLGFFIGTVTETDPECIPALISSLKLFKNLKRLKIIFANPEIVIDILKVFTNQPLEFLELEAGLDDEDTLSSLGIFLGNLKSLKHLVIKMKNEAEIYVPKAYISLFQHISELTQLRTFEFFIGNSEAYPEGEPDGSEVISAFSDCLNTLPQLKELSFQFLNKNSCSDLSNLSILTQSLKKNCQNLTKFQLYLRTKNMNKNQAFTEFLQTLSRMDKLGELTLSGLIIKNENLLRDLLETVYNLQNLRTIILENDITIKKEVFFEMLIKVALKKKTEILNVHNAFSFKRFKLPQSLITFQGIQRRNPNLITFSVHPGPVHSSILPELL